MFKHKKTELILTREEVEKTPYFLSFIDLVKGSHDFFRPTDAFREAAPIKSGEVKSVKSLKTYNELPMQFIIKQGGMSAVNDQTYYLVEFHSAKVRDFLINRNFPLTGVRGS